MNDVDDHTRATSATIDRRVARLEEAQASTDRKVDALDMKLGYMKDMMDMRLTAMQASISKIETLIEEAMKKAGDLRANPLGRQVDDRLLNHGLQIDKLETDMNQMRGAYKAGLVLLGIISALAGIASIASLLMNTNVIRV